MPGLGQGFCITRCARPKQMLDAGSWMLVEDPVFSGDVMRNGFSALSSIKHPATSIGSLKQRR